MRIEDTPEFKKDIEMLANDKVRSGIPTRIGYNYSKYKNKSTAKTMTVNDVVEEWGKRFEPATSSRGQGGLPLHGSVTDWKLTLTKEGWEHHKSALVVAITQLHEADLREALEFVIGKNFGRSIIGEHNERDAKVNREINEVMDFVNAHLKKQRHRADQYISKSKGESDE